MVVVVSGEPSRSCGRSSISFSRSCAETIQAVAPARHLAPKTNVCKPGGKKKPSCSEERAVNHRVEFEVPRLGAPKTLATNRGGLGFRV